MEAEGQDVPKDLLTEVVPGVLTKEVTGEEATEAGTGTFGRQEMAVEECLKRGKGFPK